MATDSQTEASWNCVIHRAAQRELANVTGDAGDEMTARLKQLRYYDEPTQAPYVKHLSDHQALFRVRVDGYRALCQLNRPAIEVLAVGTRSRVYDRIELAKSRGNID
jgi:mRNA-degrading endonuclease RelE of RelBE toxin-antitoxin system